MNSSSALEPLKSWSELGSFIGDLATAIGLIIASVAAYIGYGQIKAGKEAQREAVARQTYNEYLKLSIEHPDLASGNQPKGDSEFERYEWFVSYMLNACEHILLFAPQSLEWRHCVKAQLGYHKRYLCENSWFRQNYTSHYPSTLCSIINELCGAQE